MRELDFMKRTLTLMILLSATGCISGSGKDDRRTRGTGVDGPAANSPAKGGEDDEGDGSATDRSTLHLKNGDLLAQSLFRTLGRGKSQAVDTGRDLFDTYRQNFGGTRDLRLGEIHADSPSVGYVLALGILADNAAKVCAAQTAAKNPEAAACGCADHETALAMMERAMPFADFEGPAQAEVVDAFAAACEKDAASAIFSLISSLSFAAKL